MQEFFKIIVNQYTKASPKVKKELLNILKSIFEAQW